MSNNGPKVVETMYAILVNDDVVDREFQTLAKARSYVKNMRMSEDVEKVEIVKQCITHTLLNVYKPKLTRTLVAGDLDFGGDGES